ncbi:FxsA family protein [Pasteurellaceae bacterium LIM206]|nr:FxsA family protein [Pasteurellaceae bacterium LIM206]
MPFLLFILFVFLFLYAEISTLIWVGGHIGIFATLLLLIAMGAIGLNLIRVSGIRTVFNVREQILRGQPPTDSIVKSLLWLVAGVLLIIPGFLTDIIAILLLLPPVRLLLQIFFAKRVTVMGAGIWQKSHRTFYSRRSQRFDNHTQGEVFEAEYEKESDEGKRLK